VYPDGTGLGPHTDNQPGYAGSCAYYLHEDWHVTQGGLLVVFDPATATKHGDEPELPWVDGEELERDRLNSPGHGIVILRAEPTRAALRAGAAHDHDGNPWTPGVHRRLLSSTVTLTLSTEDIRVFDEVLSPEDFAGLRRHINELPFTGFTAATVARSGEYRMAIPWPVQCIAPPPGVPISSDVGDLSFARLLDEIEDHSRTAGLMEEFHGFTAAPWVYRNGTGLGPHVDGKNHYNGSYIYYLHKSWHAVQGGLLLVLDSGTDPKYPEEPELPWLDGNELEARRQAAPGHGRVILPKPNRLVLLSARAEHMITTVTRGPRLTVRASSTGPIRAGACSKDTSPRGTRPSRSCGSCMCPRRTTRRPQELAGTAGTRTSVPRTRRAGARRGTRVRPSRVRSNTT